MSSHLLTNFDIKKYYQNEPKFNGDYSRNSLPKIKDRAYIINPYKVNSVETHWIAFDVSGNSISRKHLQLHCKVYSHCWEDICLSVCH